MSEMRNNLSYVGGVGSKRGMYLLRRKREFLKVRFMNKLCIKLLLSSHGVIISTMNEKKKSCEERRK
jgi:hypothetical protein